MIPLTKFGTKTEILGKAILGKAEVGRCVLTAPQDLPSRHISGRPGFCRWRTFLFRRPEYRAPYLGIRLKSVWEKNQFVGLKGSLRSLTQIRFAQIEVDNSTRRKALALKPKRIFLGDLLLRPLSARRVVLLILRALQHEW